MPNLKTSKIMELNVEGTIIPFSITKKWKKFEDIEEFHYLQKIDPEELFENLPKTYGALPRVTFFHIQSISIKVY